MWGEPNWVGVQAGRGWRKKNRGQVGVHMDVGEKPNRLPPGEHPPIPTKLTKMGDEFTYPKMVIAFDFRGSYGGSKMGIRLGTRVNATKLGPPEPTHLKWGGNARVPTHSATRVSSCLAGLSPSRNSGAPDPL